MYACRADTTNVYIVLSKSLDSITVNDSMGKLTTYGRFDTDSKGLCGLAEKSIVEVLSQKIDKFEH
ncbi:hypothetical protein A359_03410 [secondary endosymbiont of Ctenarytaina eucalypti]|uniref:Uncharacterized protein n=1 Tax=secondary endosymbiont of Ctenarytaina eucalypti TaxID=1199245 RepID=J3VRY2_9ENTR|nr:hypothetical protein A359_03410 [secondary endosymbiont of Ctenarytaina eucalypti]